VDPEIVERHDGVFSTVMDLDAFFLGGHFIGNVRHPALLFVSIRSVPRRVHSRGLGAEVDQGLLYGLNV
jgi:hypothetical protein